MKAVAWFVAHTILATIASIVILTIVDGAILALVARLGYRPGDFFDSPCSPFVWWPGFLLGFLVNRKTQNRSACWAWTVATGWLAYGIWDECRIYRFPSWYPPKGDFVHRAWHMFFSSDSKEWGGGGLLLFIFTWPALNAIAYSVGAWLALWLGRSSLREPSAERLRADP
jgi:hypothetical protein